MGNLKDVTNQKVNDVLKRINTRRSKRMLSTNKKSFKWGFGFQPVFPIKGEIDEMTGAVKNHLINRFKYTYILIRFLVQYLENNLENNPKVLLGGAPSRRLYKKQLDQRQGDTLPACHIMRVLVNEELKYSNFINYSLLIEITDLTENMPIAVNNFQGIGGDIDLLGELLIDDVNINFDIYLESFSEILTQRLRELKEKNRKYKTDQINKEKIKMKSKKRENVRIINAYVVIPGIEAAIVAVKLETQDSLKKTFDIFIGKFKDAEIHLGASSTAAAVDITTDSLKSLSISY